MAGTARKLHRVYVLIVWLGAAAAFASARGTWYGTPVAEWLIFGLLCAIAERANVSVAGGGLSSSFAIIFPAYVLFGWPAAALLAAFSLLVTGSWQRRRRSVTLFNAAQAVLSIFVGGLLHTAAGGAPGYTGLFTGGQWALLAFPAGYFVTNHLLVGLYFALRSPGSDWQAIWIEPLRWDVLNFLIGVPSAIGVLELHAIHGLQGSLLLVVPLLITGFILRRNVGLTLANRELSELQRFWSVTSASLSLPAIYDSIHTALSRLVRHDGCLLLIWDEAEAALLPSDPAGLPEAIAALRIARGQGVVGAALASGQPQLISDTRRERHDDPLVAAIAARSLLVLPFVSDGRAVGALVLTRRDPRAFSERESGLASLLAGPAAVAVAKAVRYQRTEQLAITDPKTGLYNYRHFVGELSARLERSIREEAPLSLIYLDIDHFRETNNTHGHETADAILRDVTGIIRRCIRDTDMAARYGGEEFVIMLPGAASRDAQTVAERIRRTVERTIFRDRTSAAVVRITVSLGVVTAPQDGATADELVNKADLTMLHGAKERGRNRVAVHADQA